MSSPQSNTFFSKFLQLALVSFFTIALSLSLPPLAVSGPLGPGQPPRGRGKPPQPRNHNARTTESTPAGEVERPDQPYGKLIATLDYGTFQGAHSHEFNISYWQKIPFAAPPVGQNRFRAPQPPVNLTALYGTDYVYDSSQEFDMCPQRTVNGSEDCLYLALYSRPWIPTPTAFLRPVVIVFHGGGFIRGSASFPSPSLSGFPPSAYPILNVSSSTDLVFIYPAYRANAFGFLAGSQIVNDAYSDTNVGLLDQRAAIRWAKKYARAFGGDPEDISIWGQSAGGGSVLAHVIADQSFDSDPHQIGDKGRDGGGGLFKKALLSSPYWPKTYTSTSQESQWIYDTLVNLTGCNPSTSSPPSSSFLPGKEIGSGGGDTTLACLKSLPVQAIRQAAEYIASSHTYTTSSYTFAPVIDGLFLKKTLTEATDESHAHPLLNSNTVFATYNTHEGESFLPLDLVADDDDDENTALTGVRFTAWLEGFLPNLTEKDFEEVRKMYPAQGETETPKYSSVQVRAGLIYRDVVLACPAYLITSAASFSSDKGKDRDKPDDGHGGGGWLAEYTISPAKHASEVNWWNSPQPQQQTFPLIYEGFTGSFASFFATGDPNGHKLTPPEIPGVPELGTTKEESVIRSDGFTTAEVTHLKARCDLWRRLAPRIPI